MPAACLQAGRPTHIHARAHTQWLATRFRGHPSTREAINPCFRHLLRHSCIDFTQHPQSQLVVYTVIIAEQTVITVSENECIYQCDQELNNTGTLKPSVTIICDTVLAQPPMGFRTVSIFPVSLA